MYAGKTNGLEVAWSDVSVVQTQVCSVLIDTHQYTPPVCACVSL